MINKWNKKYLKLAKALAEDNDTCYSRSIGSVLVSEDNLVIGLGYNGPAVGVPHPDTREYIDHLYKIITTEEKNKLMGKILTDKSIKSPPNHKIDESYIYKLEGCKQCPRRLLDIPSGEKLEYCPCSHSERNALFSAAVNGQHTKGSTLFCYCQVPCSECSIAIIQCRVKKVVCCDFNQPLYSKASPGLFKLAKVQLEVVDPNTFETIENHEWSH